MSNAKLKRKLTSSPVPTPVAKRGRPFGYRRNFYHVDTKGLCLICYREGFNANPDIKPYTKKRLRDFSAQFCKQILRYLQLEFKQNIAKPCNFDLKKRLKKIGFDLCQDCSLLAENFCGFYAELEVLKMKADACVKSLADIMKGAGRISSRVKTFQERMGISVADASDTKTLTTGAAKMNVSVTKGTLLVDRFRKEIMNKGYDMYKTNMPRVRLQRLGDVRLSGATSGAKQVLQVASKTSLPIPPQTMLVSTFQSQLQIGVLAYVLTFSIVSQLANPMQPWSWQNFIPKDTSNSVLLAAVQDSDGLLDPERVARKKISNVVVMEPDSSTTSRNQPEAESSRRKSITITDSGTTVILPQVFKCENVFIDESEVMEYDDTSDMMNAADDNFLGCEEPRSANLQVQLDQDSIQMEFCTATTGEDETLPESMEEEESSNSPIDVNDRTCRSCQIQLSCRAELEKHRVQMHKLALYVECPACKDMFASYAQLKNHRLQSLPCVLDESTEILEFETIARPIFPYSSTVRGSEFCPMEGCFEVFLQPESLELHLKTHGSFSCNFCKSKYDKAHDLALHETQEHSDHSGYKCTRCNFHVGSKYAYLSHFLSDHLDIRVFRDRCEICNRGFNKKLDKNHHFDSHHDVKGKSPEEIFNCSRCKAYFLKENQLQRHLQHEHHVEKKKYMCSICNKPFLSTVAMLKHKLKDHENVPEHEVEAKFKRKFRPKTKPKCEYCGMTFATQRNYLTHKKRHEEELQKLTNGGGDENQEKQNGETEVHGISTEEEILQETETVPIVDINHNTESDSTCAEEG